MGKTGVELWHELRGHYIYKVTTEKKERYLSISKTKTFMPMSSGRDFVRGQLMRNLESACIKLRRHKLSAKKLTIYLRQSDFRGFGLEAGLNRHSSSTLDFTSICGEVFDMVFKKDVEYRATGVILSGIIPEGEDSYTLFEDPIKIMRTARVSKAMDDINKAYGKHTIHVATSNIIKVNKKHPRSNLSWRKQNLLKGESFRRRLNIPLLNLK